VSPQSPIEASDLGCEGMPFTRLLKKFNPTDQSQNFRGVNARQNPEVVPSQNFKNIAE
jgi:hypothetical protein